MRLANTLEKGDTFQYQGTTVTVLKAREDIKDRFGRPLFRFWCRRHDIEADGWLTFGEGGVVHEV